MLAGKVQEMLEDSLQGFRKVQSSGVQEGPRVQEGVEGGGVRSGTPLGGR